MPAEPGRGPVLNALNRWLTMLVVLLALVAGLGAARVWRTHGDRADAARAQERYGAVLAAADAEVTAFVNLRYDRAADSVDAIARGAAGRFRQHYVGSAERVIRVLERNRSTMSGHVVWSGVAEIGPDRATVVAATSGTVSNVRTHGQERPRHFRFRVSMVHQDGRWLTSDIDFVGDAR